jgi:hypothetical protein
MHSFAGKVAARGQHGTGGQGLLNMDSLSVCSLTGLELTARRRAWDQSNADVRAYYYLEALKNYGDPAETANTVASSLFEAWSDPDVDNRIILRATQYAKQHHGGNQLPTIEEACAEGFTG